MDQHEKLLSYMRGFHAGAGCRSISNEQGKIPEFNQGWIDGRKASHRAYEKASKQFGAELSVIRAMKV